MKREEGIKRRILEKARDHFLEHGYRGARLRRIAGDAGVTTGALYHYFRGKDALFVDVCLQGFERMDRRLASAEKMTEGRPPAERIMAFFDAYVSFFFEHRDYYELIERLQINREKLRIPEELLERMNTASRNSLAPMFRTLARGKNKTEEKDIVEQVIFFVAVAEGLFQCLRKGLMDRAHVPFGSMRSLILSKLPELLKGRER